MGQIRIPIEIPIRGVQVGDERGPDHQELARRKAKIACPRTPFSRQACCPSTTSVRCCPGLGLFHGGAARRSERHTLSVIVDNEPGVLARVIGLFSGRGYNIDSLTVSETEHAKHLSRITIVTIGTPMVLAQIKNQLDAHGAGRMP